MAEWWAVRSIYHFGIKSDGKNVFEERIVVFSGASDEEVFEKAKIESAEYAERNDFNVHGDMEAYRQDGEALIDGYEIWSQLFETSYSLENFFDDRYEKYNYVPE